MAFESITDKKIADLLKCPKKLTNPMARSKSKAGHEQINYKIAATDGSGYNFEVYKRQNLGEGMENDFSCGISWIAPNIEILTLKRYNGSSHNHNNHIEKERLGINCHIHIATEKYLKEGRKAEGFAKVTKDYYTIDGAFHCLITECNITGIQTNPDVPKLF